jgi:hypothetical protein
MKEQDDLIFEVKEVSANVYQIIATNKNGMKIEKFGTNPKDIIQEIKKEFLTCVGKN